MIKRTLVLGFSLMVVMTIAAPRVESMVGWESDVVEDDAPIASVTKVLGMAVVVGTLYYFHPELFDSSWVTQLYGAFAGKLNSLCATPEEAQQLLQCAFAKAPELAAIATNATSQNDINLFGMVTQYFSGFPSLWCSYKAAMSAAGNFHPRCFNKYFGGSMIPGAHAYELPSVGETLADGLRFHENSEAEIIGAEGDFQDENMVMRFSFWDCDHEGCRDLLCPEGQELLGATNGSFGCLWPSRAGDKKLALEKEKVWIRYLVSALGRILSNSNWHPRAA